MNQKTIESEVVDRQIAEFEPEAEKPVPPASNMMAVIDRAAQNPDVDVEKMRALLDMQKEIFAHQAFMEFADAFAKVQAEVPQIERKAENKQTKSRYAKQEHIAAALVPVATKYGFSMMFGSGKPIADGWIKATCWLMHSGGHKEYHEIDFPYDKTGIAGTVNKTDVHAAKSSYTYGRVTLTCLMFNVATTEIDDDGNGASSPPISEEYCLKLEAMIDETGADMDAFKKFFGIEKMKDLPLNRFDEAVRLLQKRRKTKAQEPK